MPSNSVTVLERYNVTGASGVIKRYPNGSDFKMELTFRLNRNGVASLDSAEVMLEDRVEYEKCEFVKPTPPPKANVSKKEAESTPAPETDDSTAKDAPKNEESKPKSGDEAKKEEEGSEQSQGAKDGPEGESDESKAEDTAEEKQVQKAVTSWHSSPYGCAMPWRQQRADSLTLPAGGYRCREFCVFVDFANNKP